MDATLAVPPGAKRRGGGTHGPLRPGELAEAAVLGDIALVFAVLGWFLPLGGALQAMSVVPMALLASRHRARAAVVATCAVAAVGFVVGGLGLLVQAWLFGSLGLAVGVARRRGGGVWRAVLTGTLYTGLPAAIGSLVLAAIFPSLRKLLLAQVNIYAKGLAHTLSALGLKEQGEKILSALTWINNHWYITYPCFEILAIALIAGIAARYIGPLLARLQRDAVPPRQAGLVSEAAAAPAVATARAKREPEPAPVPVPVSLEHASYRYPGALEDAVVDVSFEVRSGDLAVLVGPNGAGKSTVARLLAGLPPTSGRVVRPGDAGLGGLGGTAMIFQRPESQVLGVRVRDDLAWGLPPSVPCDVPALLARVGLDGMEERETSTLSGGELQRLAIAAALARSPQLMISDESTSMLDTEGQRSVLSLLHGLAGAGEAVVHVSHRAKEGDGATRLVRLADRRAGPVPADTDGPRVQVGGAEAEAEPAAPQGAGDPPREPAPVRLRAVGHVYSARTPWAHRALEGVDLDIEPGEGVVVTGPNGSGKSTLAWVLSGLVLPTEGEALIGDRRAVDRIGEVGIGFQHARLQLLRSKVLPDVAYGSDEGRARRALASVGLDPSRVGDRRVDQLSGGEQRRVALAGILAHRPVLVVLDEPLAGLDEDTRATLERVLGLLRSESGVATIVVSHDLEAASGLGGRIVTMQEGRIVSDEALPPGERP